MKKLQKLMLAVILLSSSWSVGLGQYFGEQVMEKSFEQTDFFFTPYRLIPFGIGTFKNSVAGVLDEPLINLDVNPAYLYHDSTQANYIYVDFRSAREIRNNNDIYYPYPIFAIRSMESSSFIPYPRFYLNARRELEPVISAAYLLRPTEGPLRNLSLGATYQMISQDEKYYPIPQDIYKTVLGSDYLGVRSEAAKDVPIVDKYSGADNIHQTGHFISLFSGYEITSDFQVGLKVGRVSFDREGSYGSQNLWESYYTGSSSSLWRNMEARSQSYGHWELIGGATYSISPRYGIGITGGYLWGDADQALTRGDSSYYSYGPIGSTAQSWYLYDHSGNQHQSWSHDGNTALGGINFKARVSDTQMFQFHYQYSRQSTDIGLRGAIADTSYGRSYYLWDTTVSNHTSKYGLIDLRSGSGATLGKTHRAVASLQWDISSRVKVYIGAQYENRISETNTRERVFALRHSTSQSTGSYPYSYYDSTAESKELNWDFRTKLTRFTIPIFFTIRTSEEIELIFGLNRSTSDWRVDDVTLALFDYRFHADGDGSSRKENFGERYTQPQENISDIRTTLLAGLTVSPSNVFNIRFLVVPNFVDTFEGSELQDLQWWISVNLLP